jgi:hypothetical protein
MTEPYYTQEKLPVSDVYREVLKILEDYHTKLLQPNTLKGQSPYHHLSYSKQLITSKGKLLKQFLEAPDFISSEADVELKKVMQDLTPYLEQQDNELTTFMIDWTEKMFIEFPFSLTPEHIQNLLKNTPQQLDGESNSENKEG